SEALNSGAEVILVVVEGNKRDEADIKKILGYCDIKNVQYEFCGRLDVDKIKTTDTFPGVLAIVSQPDVMIDDLLDGTPIICLDGVKDPGNLGTIIRTADWFGVKNIILSEDAVDPYNDKVVRSTMGSIFRVNIFESEGLVRTLEDLKKRGYKMVSLEMNGEEIRDREIKDKKCVYVFGSESHGIRKELEKLTDKKYTIKGSGSAESLNVAVACGIVLSRI
ncbi:RNA methyltransferase, partial [Candidatus Falkowbacteria bacterium]|nr:RNA methyltransferase [Candidatus Falkowbacteria bacterium]